MSTSRRAMFGWLGGLLAGGAMLAGSSGASKSEGERRALRRSDRLPDLSVLDQRGASVNFYTDLIADQIVFINFFYVDCQGSCPGTWQVMARLRDELSPVIPKGMRFISVTLDAEKDRPPKLAQYAADRGLDAPGLAPWTLVTGTPEDVEALRLAFGLRDPDPEIDAVRTNHAAVVVFGNDALDRWSTMPAGLRHEPLMRVVRRVVTPAGVGV
jgi:cytochrome oxidase Cu insertion factor (SCO1/SenC/PrrC family)